MGGAVASLDSPWFPAAPSVGGSPLGSVVNPAGPAAVVLSTAVHQADPADCPVQRLLGDREAWDPLDGDSAYHLDCPAVRAPEFGVAAGSLVEGYVVGGQALALDNVWLHF